MNAADIIWEDPKPPLLHTEETFRAVRAPDPSEGGAAAHWHVFFSTLSMALRSFGFPDALYDKWLIRNSERREAFNMLRLLEAMLRRMLLMLAAADPRPLEPATPHKTRGPSAAPAPTGKARKAFRGKPPAKLPIHFVLVPPAAITRIYTKPAPAPLTGVLLILEEQRRERMQDPAWRHFFKNSPVDNLGSAFVLAARFEALIRVYANPESYVMRLRQKLAAEQGRLANAICARMLIPSARLTHRLVVVLDEFVRGCVPRRRAPVRTQPAHCVRLNFEGVAPPVAELGVFVRKPSVFRTAHPGESRDPEIVELRAQFGSNHIPESVAPKI